MLLSHNASMSAVLLSVCTAPVRPAYRRTSSNALNPDRIIQHVQNLCGTDGTGSAAMLARFPRWFLDLEAESRATLLTTRRLRAPTGEAERMPVKCVVQGQVNTARPTAMMCSCVFCSEQRRPRTSWWPCSRGSTLAAHMVVFVVDQNIRYSQLGNGRHPTGLLLLQVSLKLPRPISV